MACFWAGCQTYYLEWSLVVALAVSRGWPLHQLDVQKAFNHGDLEEEVYMKQPKGFVDPNFPNHLCLLRKAIYGLKQALRAWYMRLSNFLYSLLVFFVLWAPRSSLFIQHSYSQTLYVLIYVYDIVITGSHAGAIRGLIASLATEFAIKVCFFLCTIFLVYKHGEMMRVLSYVRVNTSMTWSKNGLWKVQSPTSLLWLQVYSSLVIKGNLLKIPHCTGALLVLFSTSPSLDLT